jgi:hypothetical protein
VLWRKKKMGIERALRGYFVTFFDLMCTVFTVFAFGTLCHEVLSSKVDSFEAGLKMLHNILLVFEEFASGDNKVQLKKYIQEYDYALKQQIDYLKLFSQLCDKEMPEFFETLKDTIAECQEKIDIDFERAVKSMVIAPNQEISYYETAIKYLDLYKGEPECIKNKNVGVPVVVA